MLIRSTLLSVLPSVLLACAWPAASATDLAALNTPVAATRDMIGAPPGCKEGFIASAAPQAANALPLPGAGGATFNAADEQRWRATLRTLDGQNAATPDASALAGKGDWTRIQANAQAFLSAGEDNASDKGHDRGSNGMKARDAAFVARVTSDVTLARVVGRYLQTASAAPENDFAVLCFRLPDNSAPFDAYFEQAAWLLRYVVSYDYVRPRLPADQRLAIENYLRRQAYFFAAHLDWSIRIAFPNRLSGDYRVRASDAQPKTPADAFVSKQYDTANRCTVRRDDDDPTLYPVYAYADAQGNPGPRVSRLSQWFNNRKSAAVAAFGGVGVLLGDEVLVNRAKRYVMEWLTYSVWPDGSEGEYFRNGDYCIPRQGLVYAQYNIQAAALLAHWLALRGDTSLALFSTRDGLFGTESGAGDAKSIASVVRSELQLLTGELQRYYYEGWKTTQEPRPATSLGRIESRYMNAGRTADNHHALGILLAQDSFPGVPIRSVLSKDAASGLANTRGEGANRVATGYGEWQDVFGALPAVLLLK